MAILDIFNNHSEQIRQLVPPAEMTLDGVIVYPYISAQTPTFTNGLLSGYTTTYDSKTWTMTLTRTNGLVTQMQSTDATTVWNKTITYTADGIVDTEGVWT